MRLFFSALTALSLLAGSANAHFLYLLPKADKEGKPTVQLVFSDSLSADSAELLDKLKQTEYFVKPVDGKAAPTKAAKADNVLDVALTGTGPRIVGATCQYGVLQRGESPAFLLNYYARTIIGQNLKAKPVVRVDDKPMAELPLDIVISSDGESATIMWQGKPVADADVAFIIPGVEKSEAVKSNKDGVVKLEKAKGNGLYAIRAKYTEARAGKLGDKEYKEVRHYCTFVFDTNAVFTTPSK